MLMLHVNRLDEDYDPDLGNTAESDEADASLTLCSASEFVAVDWQHDAPRRTS
jgi:hypothetical protein